MESTFTVDRCSSNSLSSSLLEHARLHDERAWARLVQLYGPVVYRWARLSGLQSQDALDVVQEVFTSVATSLEGFRRDRPGDSFRAWLRTITQNKVRDQARRRKARVEAVGGSEAQARMADVAEPDLHGEDNEAEGSDAALLRRALEMIRAEFEPRTWQAFWQAAIDGHSPADVAEGLGLSVASVYQAKSRVLRRLRAEFDGLVDFTSH